MSLVIDASIVGAWVLTEENTAAAEAIVETMPRDATWVPQLFPMEIGNILLAAERRRRISPHYASAQLAIIEKMPFRIDVETAASIWRQTFALARIERLTVYDATYLELALRLGADLATLDKDLAAAARRRGLTVLP